MGHLQVGRQGDGCGGWPLSPLLLRLVATDVRLHHCGTGRRPAHPTALARLLRTSAVPAAAAAAPVAGAASPAAVSTLRSPERLHTGVAVHFTTRGSVRRPRGGCGSRPASSL